ncbi:hypothetical protein [Bacillus cereus group sp. MG11]|uniref:hypothetical protein n=1 Tax=Bacillus cereus group sp. MG11 TaxID=3040248 RepID=UPI0033993CC2
METKNVNASDREQLSFQVGFIMAAIDYNMVNCDVVEGFETICKEIVLEKGFIQKGIQHYATESNLIIGNDEMHNILNEYEMKE